MITMPRILALAITAILTFAAPISAQNAQQRAAALNLTVPTYTAAQARADVACWITDLAELEQSHREIMDCIIYTAQSLRQESIQIRASNGVLDRNSQNYLTIRAALIALGYTVRVNNARQTAEVSWE